MELKSAMILFVALLLLLLLLAHPTLSQGEFHSHAVGDLNNDVYEIDYRGPETHSFVPPPDQAAGGGGGGHWIHHETVMAHQHKFRGPRAHNFGDKGKTING